jgi:predicted nucleic acid-binding protein
VPATYFDASALAKLLLDEADSTVARAVWAAAGHRYGSELGYVETCAALAASLRNHHLDPTAHAIARRSADAIRARLGVIVLGTEVATTAARLAETRALKGADAVHLASALALGDPRVVVATWDRRLHAAARAEGLTVAPASLST